MKRNPQPNLAQVDPINWARLAAYIDGEGCISISTVRGAQDWSRRVMYLNLAISNTDVRLARWLKEVFGGAIYAGKRLKTQWAPCYHWYVTSRRAADVITGCAPFFIIKREQADVALAFQSTIAADRRYGRKGRPAELLERQAALSAQLSALKGTSSRVPRGRNSQTIQ